VVCPLKFCQLLQKLRKVPGAKFLDKFLSKGKMPGAVCVPFGPVVRPQKETLKIPPFSVIVYQ
jgi:3-mercaptopyruvate sulfurtransferase SseA